MSEQQVSSETVEQLKVDWREARQVVLADYPDAVAVRERSNVSCWTIKSGAIELSESFHEGPQAWIDAASKLAPSPVEAGGGEPWRVDWTDPIAGGSWSAGSIAQPVQPEPAPPAQDEEPKWTTSKQRDDLTWCPFCGTQAIEQVKLWKTADEFSYRISCGNPFCDLECRTNAFHSLQDAEDAWQTRS